MPDLVNRMTITVEMRDGEDPETTLQEVLRLVSEGYTSGFNNNEDAAFHFDTREGVEKELAW